MSVGRGPAPAPNEHTDIAGARHADLALEGPIV
jgi:hypothetical protein